MRGGGGLKARQVDRKGINPSSGGHSPEIRCPARRHGGADRRRGSRCQVWRRYRFEISIMVFTPLALTSGAAMETCTPFATPFQLLATVASWVQVAAT